MLFRSKGLQRIYQLMSSVDEGKKTYVYHLWKRVVIRKLATRLLIEMAYKNEKAQILLCECFSFSPIKGQVALNSLPQGLQKRLKNDPSLINEMKNSMTNA